MDEIRDPIHGFIHFDRRERALIDSPPVQRLRYIHQLALGYLVYPGATHSRFEHALGTMELAGRAFDAVCRNARVLAPAVFTDDERSRWRATVRIAGLLHDIGHPPFSHAGDDLFDPSVGSHEEMTRRFITSPEITELLNSEGAYRVTAEEVSYVASGMGTPASEAALLAKEIITGELGVDRMDYLLRDSQMCGVNYGLFDLSRMIETLTLARDKETGAVKLALESGGLYAAEGLLTARYFMFSQVYYHSVRASYDAHLERFLSNYLAGGTLPTDPSAYLKLDDLTILQAMREVQDDDRDAHAIVARNHFKEVVQISAERLGQDVGLPMKISRMLEQQFGNRAFVRDSEKDTVHLEQGDIMVVDTLNNGPPEDLLEKSRTLGAFQRIRFVRVYSEQDIRTNVLSSVDGLISDASEEVALHVEDT